MSPLLTVRNETPGRGVGLGVIALAALIGIGVGVRYERGQVLVAVARAERAEDAAKRLAATAQGNADAAKKLAADNEAQALAYAADAEQARSDADRFDLARQGAVIAAGACKPTPEPAPIVGDTVHRALQGRAVSEDDEMAPSMRAAMDALRAKKGRRK